MTYEYDSWNALQDDEDVRFNRRMGIDDNREGDEWNQSRPCERAAYHSYYVRSGFTTCNQCGQSLSTEILNAASAS